jgi:hypothetical protein
MDEEYGVKITVDDLEAAGLDHLFVELEDALRDHLSGERANVAVVSDPLAGRDVLLDYAEETLGPAAERVSFTSVVTDGLPDLPNSEVALLDDCHYLFTRRIGGFDVLERFLERVATSDTLFVTSWNRYAWNYLAAVREVDRDFPVRISIPRLDSNGMANLLRSHYDPSLPEFVDRSAGERVRTVGLEDVTVPLWGDGTVTVPLPELNLDYVTSRTIADAEANVQAVVIERITRLSQGDPGVALAIWERSVRDGEIAPSYIQEVDRPIELDDDEAFVLELVLSNERVSIETLTDVVRGASIERVLGTLRGQGVVAVGDGRTRIVPERLHSMVAHLERRQLLW